MRVDQVMKRAVHTCRPADELDVPARRMQQEGCGCVVVVDDHRRPLAVVTDRDICLHALKSRRPLHELFVLEAMSSQLVTCRPGDSVVQAEAAMQAARVRRLPVVDAESRLVGILSLEDLAWRAARDSELFAHPVSAEEVGRTLALASRPHLESSEPPPL